MAVCDALLARQNEPGAISQVARDFNVSRAWIYKNILPALDSVTNTPPENDKANKPEAPGQ